ncbi:MAG: DUF2807 domain-containing protein [Bacteroidales bacterium]|nr:DUF2807 domain-containing protein [Bacteroidales bacterium]
MKRLFAILAMFGLTLSLTAQDRIATADFDRVRVADGFHIILIPSDRCEVVIPESLELPQGMEAEDVVSVNRGTLTIALPSRRWGNNRTVVANNRQPDIRVYFKSLNSLKVSSGAFAKSEQTINAGGFDLRLSSGSRAELDINADEITSVLNSGANLILTGRAGEHTITASSGAGLVAEKFKTGESRINLSSGASARIHAQKATGRASTGSSIRLNSDAQRRILKFLGASVRTL